MWSCDTSCKLMALLFSVTKLAVHRLFQSTIFLRENIVCQQIGRCLHNPYGKITISEIQKEPCDMEGSYRFARIRFNPRIWRSQLDRLRFSLISRVKSGGSRRNLHYPRVDQRYTSSGNNEFMSGQVIELWPHVSGHVPSKPRQIMRPVAS